MMDDPQSQQYPIPLRTHTSLWQVEKRMYKLYDYTLPMPVSVRQLGIFLVATIPWMTLLSLIGVPFASPWHLLWIAPPLLITIVASRPVIEGKRLMELVTSQIRYLLEPKDLSGLRPTDKQDEVHLTSKVWVRR